ncbi:MAG: glycosyltransferase [Lachnospiraceae bacterium]|nr:glycosyltransferase [Lachnospiraceae bacterium]
MKTFLIIPAYRPDDRLPALTQELRNAGFENIIAVDDGSGESFLPVFSKLEEGGISVVHHSENRGKGAALRTGIETASAISGKESFCVITADADGQHAPEDILSVVAALSGHPDALVLGTRDFSEKGVPWKSRAGNRISSAFFRLTTGRSCPDTQTGLRGIPAVLIPLALSEEGDRYEYEMNFLTDAVKEADIFPVPIRTIYENNNESSHFRPFRDAVRIYGRPLRFAAASALSCAADLLFFAGIRGILLRTGAFSGLWNVMSSTAAASGITEAFSGRTALCTAAAVCLARLLSGSLNFLLNRKWSFRSRGRCPGEAARYAVLFTGVMAASALGTSVFSMLLPPPAAKILVDTALFVISYRIQKEWVFRKEGNHHVQKNQSHSLRGISRRLHDIHAA